MKENLNWGLLSKYRTELYGIAALMIMVFHCQVFIQPPGFLAAVNNHLNFGVDIFLLLSGMSLYYSYSKNNNYATFMKNRCERTVIPYLLIGLFFWIWKYLVIEFDILEFFFNVSGLSLILIKKGDLFIIGKATFWYVSFIFGMYVVYPIIYNLFFSVSEKKKRINFSFLFVFSILLAILIRMYAKEAYANIETWLTRVPSFLIGCYIGKAVKERRSFKWFDYILFFICIPFKAIIILLRSAFDDLMLHRYLGAFAALFICFAVVVVFEKLDIKPLRKILSFFGKISFEEYMIHCMLYLVVLHYIPDMRQTDMFTFRQKALMYFCILVLSTILSFLFSKAYSAVMKKIHSTK